MDPERTSAQRCEDPGNFGSSVQDCRVCSPICVAPIELTAPEGSGEWGGWMEPYHVSQDANPPLEQSTLATSPVRVDHWHLIRFLSHRSTCGQSNESSYMSDGRFYYNKLYVCENTEARLGIPIGRTTLHVRSVGNLVAIRTSTMGTCSPSSRIEVMLRNFPFRWTITTRWSRSEVVFLRLEANRANFCINSSVRTQSKNLRVFRDGEAEGLDSKVDKYDRSV